MSATLRSLLICATSIAFTTSEAAAHASGRGFVLLLPTAQMQTVGALAVAVSFALLAFVPGKALRAAFREWPVATFPLPRVETVLSLLSLVFWAVLVWIGLNGSRDPLSNPLTLMIWTVLWTALPLACALFGNLWAVLNPWSGLVRLIAPREPPLKLPDRIGYAPALIGLMAFGWFEIVDLAPDDPARLARAVAIYSALTITAMLIFGARPWLERGEFFHVFFGFIGRLAPLQCKRQDTRIALRLGLPGAGLVNGPSPPLSGAIFILCALATVSFDGVSETWWWLVQLEINPLEFPGRSAVVAQNTFGLLAACALLTGIFLLCLWAGMRLYPPQTRFAEAAGRLALSIIPISLAYHFAHYLIALLVNGQYTLAAITDPLATGADFLNLGQFYVTTSFLNNQEDVEAIWRAQSSAVIFGHIIAVAVAHRIALDIWGNARRAVLAQGPLGILMVLYTVFGLWLLASPTA